MERKLYRNTRDNVFGGVCSGLAEYMHVDKGLMRFLCAVAIVVTGFIPGLIVYIIGVAVIPTEESAFQDQTYQGAGEERTAKAAPDPENTRRLIGIALIVIGTIALAKILFSWVELKYVIPVVLVVSGAALVYKNWRHGE